MPTEKNDLRVRKTLRSIRQAFDQMICEMPYEKMTVAELCRRAEINKKTFYRYHDSMDDLLREVQLEFVSAYVPHVCNLRLPEDAAAITREFLLFSAQQDEVYERITCDSRYDIIRDQMIDYVMGSQRGGSGSSAFNALPLAERSLALAFVSSTGMDLYRRWVADGKAVPATRLADIGAALVERGIGAVLGTQ